MPEEFMMLSASFPDAPYFEQVNGASLTDKTAFALLENAFELIRKKTYDYAPIDKKAIAQFAAPYASKINSLGDLISLLKTLKPGALEAQLIPFCKDDRDPARIIEKKLAPVTDIAVGYFISILFERLFPVKIKAMGRPPKNEFRFAANFKGWIIIRKANFDVAERKEILACMIHTMVSIEKKMAQLHGNSQFLVSLNSLISKYPVRKSFGKMLALLEEAKAQNLLPDNDAFLRKYALYKIMYQLGYSPYLSNEVLEGIYPELKIPKPKGRMKKD